MSDERRVLIDDWFPIGEVSVESVRERSVSSALPPLYFLHVWFARRPLTTSRAAILCSLLDGKSTRDDVLRILGIPPDRDIVGVAEMLERAKAAGRRLTKNPLDWNRAYTHIPTPEEMKFLHNELERIWGKIPIVLDPMAGGGSIPYEAVRLGVPIIANELNPVAFVILKATVEYPARFGDKLIPAVKEFCDKVHMNAKKELEPFFPQQDGEQVYRYFWARTVRCSNCGLKIPMSPNWWLRRERDERKRGREFAVKLIVPAEDERDECSFEIVRNPRAQGLDPYKGTDVRKEALCPRCGRVTDGDTVKAEAQAKNMGHQLYAISAKMKAGKRGRWIFRAPTEEELEAVMKAEDKLREKLLEWELQELVPNEPYFKGFSDRCSVYGVDIWRDLFNSRQLFTHLIYLEKFLKEKQRLLNEVGVKSIEMRDFAEAISVYGAIVLDTCINYNTSLSRWDSTRSMIRGSLDVQAFPFKTSYAEAEHARTLWPWARSKTLDSLKELVNLLPTNLKDINIFCGDSASLQIESKSVDCIIVDPPYHENVMYGEVSDFFYIWLKRTVGDLFPDIFKTELTEKHEEAVANPVMFRDARGRGSARDLATQHYQSKMEACFRDMNRVLRDDGVLTVMFTHRKAEAWASLATALINAGFTFTASWPVFTEAGQKFVKRSKGVLKVTVLLVCRKRLGDRRGLWEQIIQELYDEAEKKVKEHSEMGITGPDLLVSVYGPVLGKFADYNLVKDATGRIKTPDDALNIVADVVNKHHTADIPTADLNTLAYINLIREFPGLQAEYDLARLTTVFGGNITLDTLDVKSGNGLVEKKGGKVNILTAHQRHQRGIINPNPPRRHPAPPSDSPRHSRIRLHRHPPSHSPGRHKQRSSASPRYRSQNSQ